MGVPKFFRYISERYPCLSELVKEHQIPEFDNLYLDMNGIIHMCSHPDDYDPHFRITEEKMFSDIFHYIEVLFRMIKPQNLFFMAVDGVAPRAKMNQQRGRRFRSAKEAEVLEAKAKDRGEELPKEARFDSNCITPGTLFMARLHEQLKYFVSNKISTDKLWQKCKIILSGHETPGEGEHKIMDYIRYMKAQPGYNPNTRHCLYGLDADLIMLGLCTHEPHFSLLREEVRFGKKSKRKNIPEQITFFLLHLSLMREYLELEFLPLKDTLPFEYDMEKIIDDWVLMGFLVGNDFIPHLPNLHINSGALPVLYNAYMKILPTLDGYINEAGKLNLERFEKFMSALGSVDKDHFSEQYADLKYFHSKISRKPNTKERTSYKPKELEVWLPDECDNLTADKAETKTTNKELAALIKSTDDMLLDDFLKGDTTDDATTEIQLSTNPDLFVTAKVDDLLTSLVADTKSTATADSNLLVDIFGSDDIKSEEPICDKIEEEKTRCENLVLLEPSESNLADLALDDIELHDDEDATSPCYSESDTEDDELMNAEFIQHKNDYYMNKLDYLKVTPEVMRDQAEGYVRAIQWNLHYYYNGVCSWSWYYPHHYAPYISDIKGFSDLKLEYELGTPFRPFEQLLAVLPAASKTLLPEPYQELMTAEESPIIDFYPPDFRTDLNGKKQEWEAVVLIPFIDEIALLKAMQTCNERLTEEEAKRNSHGPMLVYEYTEEDLGNYIAPEYFPKIECNHAKLTPVTIEEIRVPIEKLIKGPCPGSIHDIYYPGFPTLKHLKYTGRLEKAKVRVFDTPSQNENMIVKIAPLDEIIDVEELARKLLGTSVHVSWPHLVEAQVVTVSDEGCRYHKTGVVGKFSLEVNKGNLNQLWHSQKNGISIHCKEKLGIDVGETSILVHVKIVTGKKYVSCGNSQVVLQKQWADVESCYPLQAVVQNLVVYEVENKKIETIQDLFPMGSKCFMIGHPHYGSMGDVTDNVSLKSGRIKVSMSVLPEPDLSSMHEFAERVKYVPGGVAAQRLAITPHLLSRITGSIFAIPGVKGNSVPKSSSKMNIGLNLKLNKKNEEIPGYTKKVDGQWLYSYNSVQLVRSYMEFCPDLFVYITSHLGNDMFYESELFPQNIGEGKIQKIVDWIKKQPFSSIERQKVGSQTIEVEIVKKIEETVDKFNSLNPEPKQVVMQVKPHLLFKPEIQTGHLPPDSSAQYQLYDRIVNVRESYTVPFGCKGTVIGIQGTSVLSNNGEDDLEVMYDVLFDHPFPGGLQLNCSPNRGYRVPKTALINLSYGMRVVQQKTVNPATNNPWYGNYPMNQNHQQPVQSQNSAFASWTPANQNNYYRQQHPQQQQQQRMFQPPHRGMHPPPPFGHLMNHHHRMPPPPPSAQQPASGVRPSNKSEVNDEFQNFLHVLQKNQTKGKHRSPNPAQNIAPSQLRTPNYMPPGQPSVNQPRSLSTSSSSSAQSSSAPSGDPAESLKKLLNISGKQPVSTNQPSTSSVNNNVSQPISVEDFFAHARTKEQKLAQSSNQSSNNPYYSVQLLNYCQSQRIGIPRYSYVPVSNNKVRAQISLPDGRMVIGDESASKEEATENAAKIIITEMLQMNTDTPARHPHHRPVNPYSGPGPKGFPVPPKQWCQQTQKMQRTHKPSPKQNQNLNFPKQQLNGSQIQIQIRKEPAKTEVIKSPGATSFVPLQAVKQQRNKSNTNVGEANEAKRKEQGALGANSPSKNSAKQKSSSSPQKSSNSQSQSSSSSPPKQRARRSRIAANFSGVQEPKQ